MSDIPQRAVLKRDNKLKALDDSNLAASSTQPSLLRVVGLWALTASVINLSIGGSIYVLQGTFAGTLGVAAPLVFFLGALVFVPVTMCIAAAGSRISATGGPYMYVRAAFGPLPGFALGAVFWISNAAGAASLAAALIDQIAQKVPAVSQLWLRGVVAATTYTLLCLLNARGVRTGAYAIIVLAIVKLLPLVLLTAFGSVYVHEMNFSGPRTVTLSTVGSAMVLVVFCYSGMEVALSPSGEIRNPSRVVPRAIFMAIAAVVSLSIGLQIVAQGVLGSSLANNPAPLAALSDKVIPGSYDVILLAASVAMFGILQGDLLGSSRLLYALGRDQFLPSFLARVTNKRRVPLAAIVIHGAVIAVVATFGTFKYLALVSGGAMCLVYLGCCAAAWRLQQRGISELNSKPFVLPGGSIIPLLTCIALVGILTTLERQEWKAIIYALIVVMLFYGIARWRVRKTS
jgi:basic amino acid/polyamine antiporter, APA family